MRTTKGILAVKLLTLAIQGALGAVAMAATVAQADDADVKALTQPRSFVEIGAENNSQKSDKYGEYNGLHKDGGYAIGNFNIRGGSADTGDGTTRWSIYGTDLGTESRSLGARGGQQGTFNLGIHYDELRHYISDSYQTPLLGGIGGNVFTIPADFGVINSQTKPPKVGGIVPPYGAQALTATQQSEFHQQEVWSGRKNTSFTAGFDLDKNWGVLFDFNHLKQDGAKLLAAPTDLQNVSNYGAVRAEAILYILNPTNSKTDSINVALNWKGKDGHASLSYYGSAYRDEYSSVSFPNVFTGNAAGLATGTVVTPFPIDAMSTPPDNDFHQLNLTGGYNLTDVTKLVGGLSYARNTQNVAYVNADQMQVGGLPQSSLNGEVITRHADLKLTNQSSKNLQLSAGLKYNERDNRTAANIYQFYTLGGDATTVTSTPMSNRKTQFELAADYRVDPRQNVRGSYEYERVTRWCNSALANNGGSTAPGPMSANASDFFSPTRGAASCAFVPESTESRAGLNYRLKATEDVTLTAAYGYAIRNASIDPAAYNPLMSFEEGYDVAAFRPYFEASRQQNMAKLGLNWQPASKWAISASGRFTDDHYGDTAYGVQNGQTWSLNLDGSYNWSEEGSASAFFTQQRRQRDMHNAQTDHTYASLLAPTQTWDNSLTNNDVTIGLALKQAGLLGGKLALAADLTESFARSAYGTQVNYSLSSCTAPSNGGYTCGDVPAIYSRLTQLKLSGDYSVDKSSKVIVGLIYQHLTSDDYQYNALQFGYTPTGLLPTGQVNPSYSVSTVYAAYNYSFQ